MSRCAIFLIMPLAVVSLGGLGARGVSFAQQLPPRQIVVGDMILAAERLHVAAAPKLGPSIPAASTSRAEYSPEYWPAGTVPVEFAPGIASDLQQVLYASCAQWSAVARVQCVPRHGETPFLYVQPQNTGSCNAAVGISFRPDGPQPMLMSPTCWTGPTIVHELGHVLGFLHEHQRPDRDAFVTVQTANVQPAAIQAFSVVASQSVTTTEYDFRSIMHYRFNTFAVNYSQPTIIPKPGFEQYQYSMGLGLNGGPSALDGEALRAIYGTPVTPPPPGQPSLTGSTANNPVSLSWTAGSGSAPEQFVIHVGSSPGASNVGVFPMGLATSIVAQAPEGIRLFVRIIASNQYGAATSNEISFILGEVMEPGTPTLIATQVMANPITLNWVPGAGGTPQRYVLQAGTTPGAANYGSFPMGLATGVTVDAPAGVPLYVRVVAQNVAGAAISNEINFTVTPPPPPPAPVMQSPTVTGSTVSLTWSGSTSGVFYTLVARTSPTGAPILVSPLGRLTSLTVSYVPANTYYVTVVAQAGGLLSGESNQAVVVVP